MKCLLCKRTFICDISFRFCSAVCRRQYRATLTDFYVYEWYRCGELVPYYVGKGHSERAWSVHHGIHSPDRVVIYRDGLTEVDACTIEVKLIDYYRSCGVTLMNTKHNTKPFDGLVVSKPEQPEDDFSGLFPEYFV